MIAAKAPPPTHASSRNACRQCTPLGACLAFKGVEGALPFLHGSQGCATYIRRYLISHFREPMDIASSSFSEDSAVFGGGRNFLLGIGNVIRQYQPRLIGVATTCLSETIGDDVPAFLRQARESFRDLPDAPRLVHVSTPSYTGSHIDGFHEAVRALASLQPDPVAAHGKVALFPGLLSPEDFRLLRRMFAQAGVEILLVPDYADTLDGPAWSDYARIAPGGTSVAELESLPGCAAAIDFSRVASDTQLAGDLLHSRFGTPRHKIAPPIGIAATDAFLALLSRLSGRPVAEDLVRERGRLVDALVDGHKYLAGVKVAIYGEADLALGLASFCGEAGLRVDVLATGGKTPGFEEAARGVLPASMDPLVLNGADFRDIEGAVRERKPDLMLGGSKGYSIARELSIPLLRRGFPIHDRIGGQRLPVVGYTGALRLLDDLINTLLDHRQSESAIGWSYL